MSATKSGRRLVPLSEGLIPSVYIDIFSKRKYQSEGGDCSYVFRSDFSICDNAYSSRRFVLSNWQTKITARLQSDAVIIFIIYLFNCELTACNNGSTLLSRLLCLLF